MKTAVIRDVAPSNLLEKRRCFGATYQHHLQGGIIIIICIWNQQEYKEEERCKLSSITFFSAAPAFFLDWCQQLYSKRQ
jgi:hypothetical protein